MKPRWYQSEAVEATTQFLLDKKGSPLLVSPTGSGKSLMLKMLAMELEQALQGGVIILSHVREILEQNFNTLAGTKGIGLYSAGLGVRQTGHITIAGIQSVYNKPHIFYEHNPKAILVDEAHLVGDDGMYRDFLQTMGLPVIGLTATPYRLKQGYLHKGGFFTDISYNVPIDKLTEQGFLSPIITYADKEQMDTKGVGTQGGDFKLKDLSLKFNREAVTRRIVEQLEQYKNRKHWVVFCIDIAHAEQVAQEINRIGVTAEAVHSNSPRDLAIEKFKAGRIQCLVNVNILTTGFDYPNIDLIVMMRPTKSPVLHVQSVGRGLRIAPGKENCLVKDFAGNFARLGPFEDPYVEEPGKKGTGENPFMKTCPDCDKINHPSVRTCSCGHEFQFEHHLETTAFNRPVVDWHQVDSVFYNKHSSATPSMKVTYVCGIRTFSEWVIPDHPGYPGYRAKHWIKNRWRGQGQPPTTLSSLLENTDNLWKPSRIKVEEKGKYPKIINVK